jgi:hypothetical protein
VPSNIIEDFRDNMRIQRRFESWDALSDLLDGIVLTPKVADTSTDN